MRTFLLPPVTIAIVNGDISTRRVDAVVNAANNELWRGSGVAGALKARGGTEIEREAMAQGAIRPGEAVITTGGRLPAPHVIHAAAMGQDLRTDAALIAAATRSALTLASGRNMTSIAFPALGTGVGGFSVAECARVMLGALREHVASGTMLRDVEFVLFGESAAEAFADAAAAALKPSSPS
jgi:O-acetyl-ADP-ribose deacetylase (regulator of RNase III)